jgi:hypothetical protein
MMSDAEYCRALAEKYQTYVPIGADRSPTTSTVAGNVAIAQCEAGNTASGIAVLEQKLRDAKIDLPSLPQSRLAAAPMSDADYCRALTQKYQIYVLIGWDRSPMPNRVDSNIAISQCEAGNAASGIPVLERKLRDAKIDLPTRG